ncbi:uncharacterized protein LOC102701694 isoform X1 [Oryza brachyantha]|uniref:uncharacterized protein LOC102701694 isoform X1 n=1 Tax=Oryza brachyantha TaxID=4533 RepID=UPI00077675C6|nr:uncharacterized protein LOC102701694 isoform X1 [Oryza brachyantha]
MASSSPSWVLIQIYASKASRGASLISHRRRLLRGQEEGVSGPSPPHRHACADASKKAVLPYISACMSCQARIPLSVSPLLKGFRYMSEKRDTNGIETTEKFGSLLVERMSGLLETSKSIADSLERIARSLENPPVNKDYIEALNLQKPPPEDQLKHDVDDLVKDHNMIAKTVAVFLGEVRRQFPEVVGLSWIDSCITVGSDPWIQNLSRLALEILRKVRQEHPEWIVGLYLGSLLFLMVALSFSAPAESYYICDCMWYMHHAF